MHKAYSYIRFSSSEQRKGRSEPRQLEECAIYCAKHNLSLVQSEEYTFLDRGKSGFKAEHLGENGQLARFLRLVKDGSIPPGSTLIVENLDRLSREHVKHALPRFIDLLNANINVVTLTDGKVYTSEFSELDLIMSIFIMTRAHGESLRKSGLLGDAWRKKKENAAADLTPLGNNAPLWITYTKVGGYALHPERAELVRRIFQLSIDGRGRGSIAKILNGEGIPAFKGGSWATTSINRLLSNRAVLGEYQPRTGSGKARTPSGIAIPGFFPAAIEESLFDRAQEASTGRYINRSTKQSKNFNVWSGVALCTKCQSSMHMVSKGLPPKGYTYLTCQGTRKGICDAKSVRLDASELVFREILAKVGNQSLVQANASKLEHDLQAVRGKLLAEQDKLQDLATALDSFPSARGAQSLQKQEQVIAALIDERNTLAASLAADTIIDKEAFFADLDLVSYEGRAQANALLKRLKIVVAISKGCGDSRDTTGYGIFRSNKLILAYMQLDSNVIAPIDYIEELDERIRLQDAQKEPYPIVDF